MLRRKLVKSSFNQKSSEEVHYSPTTGVLKGLAQFLHGLDIYTDMKLALKFYEKS